MLKVNLTEDQPKPLTVDYEDVNGDIHELRFTFKRRLTRQQRIEMTKSVGKGRKSREVPDLHRMWRATIESIEGLEVDGEERPVTRSDEVVEVMDKYMPEEVVEPVNEYILRMTTLDEPEGNA